MSRSKFTVLAFGLFLLGMNMTSVNVMLPDFQKNFHASLTRVTLIISLYIGVGATLQIFFGRLADLWSGWNVFLIGMAVFILGSIFCSLSRSLDALICARILQGAGAAMMAATFGAVIISDGVPEKTGSLFCVLQFIMMAGTLAGPASTGFLLNYISWKWIFAANIPIGTAGLLIAFFAKSAEKKDIDGKESGTGDKTMPLKRLDITGNIIWAVIIAAFLFGCSAGKENGWGSVQSCGAFSVMLISVLLFLICEKYAEFPLISSDMLRDRTLASLVTVKVILAALQAVLLYLIPFYLINIHHCGVENTGLFIGGVAVTTIPVILLLGQTTDRIGGRKLILAGAMLLWAVILPGSLFTPVSSITLYFIWASLVAVTITILLIPSSVIILKLAPPGKEGIYSAINIATFPVGTTIGLSIAAIIGQAATPQGTVTLQNLVNIIIFMTITAAALIPLAAIRKKML